ncbi:NAD-dependent deacylase [Metalysinibacillus jejuensis]|uniref:NAD-dependent deacylase n=1 Tax=Metalysinibacillus jejuensis TaxID=914327 RepID=UPI000D3C3A21|nr:NAD-dependent deacylase [Metalysinibacillus jejuensis]
MVVELMKEAKCIVIFTGAGMSTESGLPDFRSDQGVWQTESPARVASINALNEKSEQFFKFYRTRVQGVRGHKPHKGHHILAKWQAAGIVDTIITQNVDGFHTAANSSDVLELHGTLGKVHCQNCQKEYDNIMYEKRAYYCECGGVLRPSVILFGELLDDGVITQAVKKSESADLFIVLGSSLTVSPANQFPLLAYKYGAKLVIVNEEETPYDHIASSVIRNEKIGDFLARIDNELND